MAEFFRLFPEHNEVFIINLTGVALEIHVLAEKLKLVTLSNTLRISQSKIHKFVINQKHLETLLSLFSNILDIKTINQNYRIFGILVKHPYSLQFVMKRLKLDLNAFVIETLPLIHPRSLFDSALISAAVNNIHFKTNELPVYLGKDLNIVFHDLFFQIDTERNRAPVFRSQPL